MGLKTGLSAKITVKKGQSTATEVAYVSGVSLETSVNLAEIKSLGAKWIERVSGIRDWSVDIDGYVDTTDTGQKALFEALEESSSVEVMVYLDDDETTPVTLTGNALIESLSIDVAPDDAHAISASLKGNGALTPSFIS